MRLDRSRVDLGDNLTTGWLIDCPCTKKVFLTVSIVTMYLMPGSAYGQDRPANIFVVVETEVDIAFFEHDVPFREKEGGSGRIQPW
jgi:hypothetical protein